MATFTKGSLSIDTDIPTEAAELRRDGFVEQKPAAAPKPTK
jgi:hypothetical protein